MYVATKSNSTWCCHNTKWLTSYKWAWPCFRPHRLRIHTPHSVADLNQSETRNATFSADFLSHTLVSQTTARHTLTQCGFVVFGSIATTQQNGCSGAYWVIELEQFPVPISKDKAPTPLTTVGILFFLVFLLLLLLLSLSFLLSLCSLVRFLAFQSVLVGTTLAFTMIINTKR